jgi:hypothetical protein
MYLRPNVDLWSGQSERSLSSRSRSPQNHLDCTVDCSKWRIGPRRDEHVTGSREAPKERKKGGTSVPPLQTQKTAFLRGDDRLSAPEDEWQADEAGQQHPERGRFRSNSHKSSTCHPVTAILTAIRTGP